MYIFDVKLMIKSYFKILDWALLPKFKPKIFFGYDGISFLADCNHLSQNKYLLDCYLTCVISDGKNTFLSPRHFKF